MKTVVITDAAKFPFKDDELQVLKNAEIRPILIQATRASDIVAVGQEAIGLIVFGSKITAEVINDLPHLKIIARCGIGLDNIDVSLAATRGITVTNVPDYCLVDVAEYVILAILGLSRQVVHLDHRVRSGFWDPYPAYEPIYRITNKTLGIIGLGNIGKQVAKYANALGMHVMAYDPYVNPTTIPSKIEMITMDQLLHNSDFLSIHVPLNPFTYHFMGEEELAKMKQGAFLINSSRGQIVDEDALVAALANGHLGGAALDVLATEPPDPENPLFAYDNVIFTPHSAAHTEEALATVRLQAICEVINAVNGSNFIHSVTP